MQQLDVVRLVSGELHFGCMRGALSDGTPVSVVLYEHRRQVLLGGCPQNGDMVACSKRHYGTVYDPHVIMSPDDVAKQCLLRQCLPTELAEQILPVRRPLQRAHPRPCAFALLSSPRPSRRHRLVARALPVLRVSLLACSTRGARSSSERSITARGGLPVRGRGEVAARGGLARGAAAGAAAGAGGARPAEGPTVVPRPGCATVVSECSSYRMI